MSNETKHEPINPVLSREISLQELRDEGYLMNSNGYGVWFEKPGGENTPEVRVFLPDWVNELMERSRREGEESIKSRLRALLKKR
jgi:hypothetical protein